ncbi:hypothetical protein BU15DRAFT_59260 [Melanogaster broomeanus]|nr:hypothetical protein BU15DRAFT_59260 [Melanogaster broomeanus]
MASSLTWALGGTMSGLCWSLFRARCRTYGSPSAFPELSPRKRRRLIDRGREERLKALAAAEGNEDPDPRGGSGDVGSLASGWKKRAKKPKEEAAKETSRQLSHPLEGLLAAEVAIPVARNRRTRVGAEVATGTSSLHVQRGDPDDEDALKEARRARAREWAARRRVEQALRLEED